MIYGTSCRKGHFLSGKIRNEPMQSFLFERLSTEAVYVVSNAGRTCFRM